MLNFFKRALYKTIVMPLRYGSGKNYNAAKYWHDRFSKYKLSPRGAGDETVSEEENEKIYAKIGKIFTDLCRREGVEFRNANVLEIGCGAGFYTQLLHNLGVKNYVGSDITDVLFPELKKKFSQYKFIRKDITSDRIDGKFDLVVMIDVIEHILNETELSSAMENIKNCLIVNGIFMVATIVDVSKRRLFYVRAWSLEDIKKRFPGYIFKDPVPFRYGYLLIIKKP